LILEFNEKRKEEIKDESVWSDVENVRKRMEVLEKWFVEYTFTASE